jgi:hypoxanthine phosphoribosyltransferase
MDYSILINKDEIDKKVQTLGEALSRDYVDKNPLLVGVLKGAFMFMADLTRNMKAIHSIDFMAVSSYGSSTSSSGVVRILKDLDEPITNRHLIIVEDIIDSGLTLKYIRNLLSARSPASIATCALLDKKAKHPNEDLAEYVGFEIPDKFVIGYGLDFDQKYRNLPHIGYFTSGEGFDDK